MTDPTDEKQRCDGVTSEGSCVLPDSHEGVCRVEGEDPASNGHEGLRLYVYRSRGEWVLVHRDQGVHGIDGTVVVMPVSEHESAIDQSCSGVEAEAEAALEVERRRTEALLGEMTTMARERDQLSGLYEAAMNWFPDVDWMRFEESDLFRDANAIASLNAGEAEPSDSKVETDPPSPVGEPSQAAIDVAFERVMENLTPDFREGGSTEAVLAFVAALKAAYRVDAQPEREEIERLEKREQELLRREREALVDRSDLVASLREIKRLTLITRDKAGELVFDPSDIHSAWKIAERLIDEMERSPSPAVGLTVEQKQALWSVHGSLSLIADGKSSSRLMAEIAANEIREHFDLSKPDDDRKDTP